MTRTDLVHDFLFDSAERRPDAPAVAYRDTEVRYGDLARAARATAAWLASEGLRPGDRVALLQPDPVPYLAAYFGTMLAGGIAVPMHPQATARNVRTVLRDCQPTFVATAPLSLPVLREALEGEPSAPRAVLAAGPAAPAPPGLPCPVVPFDGIPAATSAPAASPRPSDPALLVYTSGTTGRPKGVELSHGALAANTRSIVEYLRLGPEDRVLHVLPFSYSYGNSIVLTHVAVGGSIVVEGFSFPNVVLDRLERDGITGFSGVPSTYAVLLERSGLAGRRFPSLRYATSSGAPIAPALVRRILDAFPGVELFLMYGLTEASTRLTYLPPSEVERRPESIGKAVPGVRIELLDEEGRPVPDGELGEIVASGPNLMTGYWRNPELTARVLRDGRLWTGDLARRDAEGWLRIVGRQSDLVKSAGHRIAPEEIEEVLREHPGVEDAAVLGVPDEIAGEALEAWIVPRGGAPPAEKELVAFCRDQLPPFKVPRRIRTRTSLPRTASGKLLRGALREELRREAGPSPDAA